MHVAISHYDQHFTQFFDGEKLALCKYEIVYLDLQFNDKSRDTKTFQATNNVWNKLLAKSSMYFHHHHHH